MAENKFKLIIATPFYNMQGYSPYIESMVMTSRILTGAGVNFEFWAHSGDSYVDRARNTICAKFLESDGTHLLFVDSDMGWSSDAMGKMIASPYEITGCAYPLKNNWNQWGVELRRGPDGKLIIDEQGFVESWWVPAGFMMLTRSAIEKMVDFCKDDFYYDSSADNGKVRKYYNLFKCDTDKHGEFRRRYGEDVCFCQKWIENGGRIWIRPDIEFGHYGTMEWRGKLKDKLDEDAKNISDLVSIIIPCYNYAQYLGDAVESAMAQTYKNIEVIVVNDGSTDNTDEIAKKYPVTLISKPHKGLCVARNTGISASRGKWICCLDADDVLDKEYIEKLLGKADVCGSWYKTFGDEEKIYAFTQRPTYQDFLKSNQIVCAAIFRKDLWAKVNGYDENGLVEGYEDWDLWLRMARDGASFFVVQKPLFNYRKHGRSLITMANENSEKLVRYIFSKHSIQLDARISEMSSC